MQYLNIFLIALLLLSCSKPETRSIDKTNYNNSKLLRGILNYRVPGSWQRVQPSSSMRVDEMVIDPTSQSKLAVFIFPRIPDLVSSNVERWKSQFERNSLRTKLEQYNYKGLPVTIFEAEGDFMESTNPMNPNAEKLKRPDHKMLVAIVELQDGAWFFKAVGSKQVITNQESNFRSLLDSLVLVKS